MIKGRRECHKPAPANVLGITAPTSICGAAINAANNIPVVITSAPLPLPSNDSLHWAYEQVDGDQPLTVGAQGVFKVRTCVVGTSQVTSAGAYINVANVFAVTGTNPRPTVTFWNTAGWVKLKVYVTDGYTVVSTGVIVVGTSAVQCQAALGVVTG